jgi:hypothetical protein
LSITQQLPASLGIGPFGFECSLDRRPAADFSVTMLASRGGHAALSQLGSMGITNSPLDSPGWTRIRQFARSWVDVSSSLSGALEEVSLEFDVCLTRDAAGDSPSVFFSLGYQSPQEPAMRKRLAKEYLRVAKKGLDILEGRLTDAVTLSTLAECFYFLPTYARILFLGAMTSRDTGTIRAVVSGLSLEEMVRYLRRLGLRKPVEHLSLVASISCLTDDLWLAIDVQETGVAPRIGFDCYYKSTAQSHNNRKWADLLDFLVERGICTVRKRDALLDAADMSIRKLDEAVWPESLRRVSKILGPAGFNRIGLYIHHIKLIAGPGVRLEAKAYLCGTYRWPFQGPEPSLPAWTT